MANRYWVAGTGNWTDNVNHWASVSGGAPGASTPTASDNVFFDANSGSGTVSLNTTCNCLDCDFTGSSISTGSNGNLEPRGNLTLKSGMFWGNNGTLNMRPLSGTTVTLKTNGVSLNNLNRCNIQGADGTATVKLNGLWLNESSSGGFNVLSGVFDTDGFQCRFGIFSMTGTLSRGFYARASAISTFTSNLINGWTISGSGWFFDKGTSTITLNFSGNGSSTFNGAGASYATVNFGSGITSLSVSGSNSFDTLTIPSIVGGRTVTWPSGGTTTIGTLNANGVSNGVITFTVGTLGTKTNFNVTTPNVSRVAVRDNDASAGATIYDTNGVNNGNTRNWFMRSKKGGAAMFLFDT